MNLEDWKSAFLFVSIALVLIASTPLMVSFLPRSEEPFIAMAIIGEEGMAEHYYPNDDPTIPLGTTVKWHLYLYNHMGSVQYVAVKAKILGPEIPSPNATLCTPSPTSPFYELRHILADNETWITPLQWSISQIWEDGDALTLSEIIVNDQPLNTNITTLKGRSLRMVLELWVYDQASSEFRFDWVSHGEPRCSWNQIWFNVTLTG